MWHCSLSILKKSFKEQVLYIRATAVQRLRKGRGAGEGPAGEAQEAREPMGKLGEGEAGCGGRSAGNSRDGGQVPTAGTARGEGAGGAVTPPPQKHREDDLEVFSKDTSLMDTNSFSPLMPDADIPFINDKPSQVLR